MEHSIKRLSEMRKVVLVLALAGMLSACSSSKGRSADILNPFISGPGSEYGERNADSLLDGGGSGDAADRARHALEVMGSYQRALPPQPTVPVIVPAEVRCPR